ncbi:DUF397 domain-containing protein [Streptomyces spiramenti]|uniref:DUF397 domain-containing protein n=1 Tax=Streptomyces spiramenti TaxID=2720606 RepID=A0ABX1AF86_9ACTN|nr:DUF397 domain-containing protein [Streptomyces spiramenti]NJP65813.1 DUF397 domain-containing protein [Streptomyces spiramenti]
MTTGSSPLTWVKSSYSGNGGTCVEWAPDAVSATGTVPVRDSKQSSGPAITVSPAAFAAFVTGVSSGELRG